MRGAPKKTSADAIVAAAGSLFAERGVAATAVADIVRRSEGNLLSLFSFQGSARGRALRA
jgi:AcrR family transcriptional regulator